MRLPQDIAPVNGKDFICAADRRDVGKDRVSIKREATGNTVTITRQDLENKDTEWHRAKRRRAIVEKLWDIGSYK